MLKCLWICVYYIDLMGIGFIVISLIVLFLVAFFGVPNFLVEVKKQIKLDYTYYCKLYINGGFFTREKRGVNCQGSKFTNVKFFFEL